MFLAFAQEPHNPDQHNMVTEDEWMHVSMCIIWQYFNQKGISNEQNLVDITDALNLTTG